MKIPTEHSDVEIPSVLNEKMFHDFFSEMSEKIEFLHMLLSDYSPKYFDSYIFFRSNANKIFQNFLSHVEDLVDEVRLMDNNCVLQESLF